MKKIFTYDNIPEFLDKIIKKENKYYMDIICDISYDHPYEDAVEYHVCINSEDTVVDISIDMLCFGKKLSRVLFNDLIAFDDGITKEGYSKLIPEIRKLLKYIIEL